MSLKNWLLGTVRVEDFIPGQTYSPLDSAVQLHSTDAVEKFFTETPGAFAVSRAFSKFVDDQSGQLALKKSYLALFEGRARVLAMRTSAPSNFGFGLVPIPRSVNPIDLSVREFVQSLSAGEVVPDSPSNRVSDAFRIIFSGIAYFFSFMIRAMLNLIAIGEKATPVRCRVAAPDIAPLSEFEIIDATLSATAGNRSIPYNIAIVKERGDKYGKTESEIPVIDPNRFRIPRGELILRALIPGLILSARLFAIAATNSRDTRVSILALMAMQQAATVIQQRRIAHAVRCDYYLDWVEYNELHILRDIELRKLGGCVVRWPHSSLYAPGVFTSYLGYSLFCSNGPYPARRFGKSWSDRTETLVTGYLQFDHRLQANNRVLPKYRDNIEAAISRGQKLVAYFCSSDVAGLVALEIDALKALWSALSESDGNWFLVIKPKSHNKQHIFDLIRDDPVLVEMYDDDRVLMIEYPDDGEQVCASGWLADKMSIGAGILGSISAEAMTRGRAFYSYYPVFDLTEHSQKLIDLGFLHLDLASFRDAISKALESETTEVYDNWYFENFDPFRDEEALSRVAARLTIPSGHASTSDQYSTRETA